MLQLGVQALLYTVGSESRVQVVPQTDRIARVSAPLTSDNAILYTVGRSVQSATGLDQGVKSFMFKVIVFYFFQTHFDPVDL